MSAYFTEDRSNLPHKQSDPTAPNASRGGPYQHFEGKIVATCDFSGGPASLPQPTWGLEFFYDSVWSKFSFFPGLLFSHFFYFFFFGGGGGDGIKRM